MSILSLTNQYHEILELWNSEMGSNFFIPNDLFETQIVQDKLLDKNLSKVVYQDGKLIGFLIVKSAESHPIKGNEQTIWISILYIKNGYQRTGIGTKLLQALFNEAKQKSYQQILIGKDIHNLFCGVPVIFESLSFFEKQGFILNSVSSDMHKKIMNHEQIKLHQKTPYSIGLSTLADQEDVKRFFLRVFPGRWLYEYEEYVKQGGTGREFVIIRKDSEVIAFCRINDHLSNQNMYNRNWRSEFENLIGVGPLGVDGDYRGLHLGYDVTAFAMNEAVNRGATDIIIDWTSKVAFYEKFGCNIWRQYWSLSMDLRG